MLLACLAVLANSSHRQSLCKQGRAGMLAAVSFVDLALMLQHGITVSAGLAVDGHCGDVSQEQHQVG